MLDEGHSRGVVVGSGVFKGFGFSTTTTTTTRLMMGLVEGQVVDDKICSFQ